MIFDGLVEHWIYRGVERPLTARAYEYVLAGNGVWKRARSRHIVASVPVALARVAGLPDLEVEVAIMPGRIPGRLLMPILADARRHALGGREWMYQIRLVQTLEGLRWRVASPGQRSSGAQIEYQTSEGGGVVVCDVHSHHGMRAFFSGTDDRDEAGFRFYAVIGRVLARPEISLRLGMYGDFFYVPACTLFTDPGPFADVYHEEWGENGNGNSGSDG